MASDDTEHAAFTAWAISGHPDPEIFRQRLRRAFRRWIACLPAGVGLATLRAGLRTVLGCRRTGIHSAGNGPLMRAPVLAVAGPENLEPYLTISTQMTHTDPRVMERARQLVQVTRYLSAQTGWSEIPGIAEHPQQTPEEFVRSQGWTRGVSGFVEQTAPVVMLAALRYRDDYRQAVQSVIRCGGDTDTTAALVGGMVGARLGPDALPQEWLKAYRDWPHSLDYLRDLAEKPQLVPVPAALSRNLAFGTAVLGYGIRRLLPF
jgi:ADP-ribosyl-[dinitrogen reductase] hydrolase